MKRFTDADVHESTAGLQRAFRVTTPDGIVVVQGSDVSFCRKRGGSTAIHRRDGTVLECAEAQDVVIIMLQHALK